ncbi:hypothetical protein GJ496_006944 [Pomphorhynchus laevis]|nr:hypothetical protein GJ496_006944 [Pomphorhynchus laevis]
MGAGAHEAHGNCPSQHKAYPPYYSANCLIVVETVIGWQQGCYALQNEEHRRWHVLSLGKRFRLSDQKWIAIATSLWTSVSIALQTLDDQWCSRSCIFMGSRHLDPPCDWKAEREPKARVDTIETTNSRKCTTTRAATFPKMRAASVILPTAVNLLKSLIYPRKCHIGRRTLRGSIALVVSEVPFWRLKPYETQISAKRAYSEGTFLLEALSFSSHAVSNSRLSMRTNF